MPLGDRVLVARTAALALRVGPAVVGSRLDHVQLVPGVLAELRGEQPLFAVPGQPLHVPVAVRVHGGVGEGVAGRGLAVRGHPQDLAAEGLLVLRQPRVAALARARVEHLVGAERDPPAVVDHALGDAPEDRVRRAQLPARGLLLVVQHAHDAVVGGGGVVGVDHVVGGVAGGERDAEEAALAGRGDPGHLAQLRLLARLRVDAGDGGLVAGGDQQVAAGQRGQAPGAVQSRGDRAEHLHRALRGRCLPRGRSGRRGLRRGTGR